MSHNVRQFVLKKKNSNLQMFIVVVKQKSSVRHTN